MVLLLNGSPRGNASHSLILARAFVQGISSKTGMEVCEVAVTDKSIQPCRGSFSSWRKPPGDWVISDDMAEKSRQIIKADYIVASFPLYYFGMPAQMKALLDRTLPLMQPYDGGLGELHVARYDFRRTKFAVVSTCGYAASAGIYDALKRQLDMILGEKDYAFLRCPQGEILTLDSYRGLLNRYLSRVKAAGGEFAELGTLSPETDSAIQKPLLPQRAFERIVAAHWER